MKRLAVALFCSWILVSPGSAQSLAGRKAPNFALKSADGTIVELAKLRGKVVVVNFWATWCRPCRAELPDFVETYKALKAKGVEFVGIAVDQQGWSIVTPFVAKAKIIYPIVLPDNHVLSDYGRIDGIPTTFIIDRSGTIVEHHVGGLSRAELTRKLEQVL